MRSISVYRLSASEREGVFSLAAALEPVHRRVEDQGFLRRARTLSCDLPEGLREFLERFRLEDVDPACVVSGLIRDDGALGPTPARSVGPREEAREERLLNFALAVVASYLGDIFGWASQHGASLIHDLVPLPEHEHEQFGTGSGEELAWHTEDAFHFCRADYVGLFCVRNPDAVASTIGYLNAEFLDAGQLKTLTSQEFVFPPDPSYLLIPEEKAPPDDRGAIVFGDESAPYLRIDPTFMPLPEDPASARAMREAILAIQKNLKRVVLSAGDYLLLNNKISVHGRMPFRARYDGTDRWIKRLNITRDLSKSRELRASAEDRIIRFG